MTLRLRVALPVAGLLLLSLAPRAHAQGELERARALFVEAGELERQGQWPAAQDRLRAALLIRETANLRYALGWALENDEQLIEARTEYEVALRLAQRSANDEVMRLATTRIGEVDHNTPIVQVRIRSGIAREMHVFVDGREVQIRGDAGTLAVDPGPRVVRVENGTESSEQTVSVARGVLRVVEIKGNERMTVLEEPSKPSSSHAMMPWVLVGGGGVLVATSILLFASSASDASTRDDKKAQWCDATACVNGSTATLAESDAAVMLRRDSADAASRGNTKQIVGGVLGGVGAVGIGVGVYMLLKKDASREAAKNTRLSSLKLDASPLPGGARAGASFAF